MGLLDQLRSFGQGASNSAASNVSAPIDAMAWLLRKGGLPIPSNPVGGSDWMAQRGLTAEPQNRLAGLLGEGFGGVAPIFAAAKAPQIAGGLLRMGENAAAPNVLSKQSGMIDIDALKSQFPDVDFSLSQRGNQAALSKVVVPESQRGKGMGTDFMSALSKAADSDGTQLALSPSGDFGGNKKQLIEFYKRFGFVPNKGKSIDFSISESMRREAK